MPFFLCSEVAFANELISQQYNNCVAFVLQGGGGGGRRKTVLHKRGSFAIKTTFNIVRQV